MTGLLAASVLAMAGVSSSNIDSHQASFLYGTWKLESFAVLDAERNPRPWGFDVTGLLIYTTDGYMSVAINRFAPWHPTQRPNQPAEASVRSLFYAGRYEVEGDSVVHLVEVASDPGRVGVKQKRRIALEGDRLSIVTEDQDLWAQLLWRRIL